MKKKKYLLSLAPIFVLSLVSCSDSLTPPTNLQYLSIGSDNLNIHTDKQQSMLDCATISAADSFLKKKDIEYNLGYLSDSASRELMFTWDIVHNDGDAPKKFYFDIAEDAGWQNGYKRYSTKNKEVSLSNLKINTQYYYRVISYYDDEHQFSSETQSFTTQGGIIRNIDVDGVENFRDLGGYFLENGKTIKQGMIYRSAQFNYDKNDEEALKSAPTSKGKDTLVNELGIKTDIDLREKNNKYGKDETYGITSSPIGSSVNYVHLPMRFGGTNIFTNELNTQSILSFFNTMADVNNYPMVFHCIRGTDRTGALAYAIEALCGANYDDMGKDYIFSNFAYINGTSWFSRIPNYVDGIANAEGETISEKAKTYLMTNVGVSEATLDAIISILTE